MDVAGSSTYPILKVSELIQSYRDEIGVMMTTDHFNNPTAEEWYNNYLKIVAKILKIVPNDLNEILRSMPEKLEYANLYVNSLVNGRLTFLIRNLLSDMGATDSIDFTLMDIRRPNKKRLIQILSSFLNFIRFQESQRLHIDNILASERAYEETNRTLVDKVRSQLRVISEKEADKMDLQNQAEAVRVRVLETCEWVKTNKLKVNNQKEEVMKAQQAKQETKMAIERKLKHRDELKNRLKNAQSRIVQSPMRLQQDISQNKNRKSDLIKEYEGLKNDYWLAKEQVAQQSKMKDEMLKVKNELDELKMLSLENKQKMELLTQKTSEAEIETSRWMDVQHRVQQQESKKDELRENLYKMDLMDKEKKSKSMSHLNQLKIDDTKILGSKELKKKELNSLASRKVEIQKDYKAHEEMALDFCEKIVKSAADYIESIKKKVLSKCENVEKDVDKWYAEN